MNRRTFINMSTAFSSGFILGLSSCEFKTADEKKLDESVQKEGFLQTYIKLTSEGDYIIYAPVPEIGQGVRTSLPLLLAEELDTKLTEFTVVQAEANDKMGGMAAAGSDSIADYYEIMRKAGAVLREMLISAASRYWSHPANEIGVSEGHVIHKDKKLRWNKLIPQLKEMDVPEEVTLKKKEDYQWIGNESSSPDLNSIINGTAKYGMDVRLQGMKYAAIRRCPVYKGKLKSYDDVKTLQIPGVLEVLEVQPSPPVGSSYTEVLGGVAVVAEDTWSAFRGREALNVNWDTSGSMMGNSKEVLDQKTSETTELRTKGNVEGSFKSASEIIESIYTLPLMAHMCMEPNNFTAHIKDDSAFLTGPTQVPRTIQAVVARTYDLPVDQVKVIPTLAGGGFGRRLAIDYALEAAAISKSINLPVQLVWSREDDVSHDLFRTASVHHLKAGIRNHKVDSWKHSIYTQPIGDGPIYEVQGGADIPLDIPNIKVSWGRLQTAVKIGSWRSVSHSFNSFVFNSWVDEIAYVLGNDPKDLHLDLLGNDKQVTIELPLRGRRGSVTTDVSRSTRVIERAAILSGWGRKVSEKNGMGLAHTMYKNSYAAHVTELEVTDKKVHIKKITAVLDCGEVIDPDRLRAQMEGAVMDGIVAVFFNEVTYTNGVVDQKNFDTLKWARINHCPDMELEIINSDGAPSGGGEPPFPSVVPSIANAIFNATGIRLYQLPASHYGLSLS